MVNNDKNLPEPPNGIDDNLTPSEEIIPPVDSDTDDEEADTYGGYNLLHLSTPENANESSDNEEDARDVASNDRLFPAIEEESVRVWNSPRSFGDLNMDNSKIEEVKQVMLNITLPAAAIPEWANNVPEDEWKEHLINRINNLQNK